VNLSTVGQGVLSSHVSNNGGDSAAPDSAWARISGTSYAAAQIAGAIARLCDEHGLTPQDAVEALKNAARSDPPGDGFGRAVRILRGLP
jgi:hypothetical protein